MEVPFTHMQSGRQPSNPGIVNHSIGDQTQRLSRQVLAVIPVT
jgi:hypothetical protein